MKMAAITASRPGAWQSENWRGLPASTSRRFDTMNGLVASVAGRIVGDETATSKQRCGHAGAANQAFRTMSRNNCGSMLSPVAIATTGPLKSPGDPRNNAAIGAAAAPSKIKRAS